MGIYYYYYFLDPIPHILSLSLPNDYILVPMCVQYTKSIHTSLALMASYISILKNH